MIRWSDLTPEEQDRWREYAEIRFGEPVAWDDIEQAPREYGLMIVRMELQRNRWDDKSMEEREAALAEMARQDREYEQMKLAAARFVARELGVDFESYGPDVVETLLASGGKLRLGATRGPGPPKLPLAVIYQFAVTFMYAERTLRHIKKDSTRRTATFEWLRQTRRWGKRKIRGKDIAAPRTTRSMGDLLARAKAIPPVRDMLEGRISRWECQRILPIYELMLHI